MKTVLSIIILSGVYSLSAQTFSKIYDFQEREGLNYAVNIETTDFGYIVFQNGVQQDSIAQGGLGIFGIDEEGNLLFDKEYGDAGIISGFGGANSGDKTEQGSYVGSIEMIVDDIYEIGFFEFDQNGDSIQTGMIAFPYYSYPNAVIQSVDSSYIITGVAFDTTSFDQMGYLLKVNSNLEIEWSQTYIEEPYSVTFNSVINSHEGGYILSGGIHGGTPCFLECPWDIYKNDMIVIKTDSLGNEVWRNTYGTCCLDGNAHLSQTNDGNYVFAGSVHVDTVFQFSTEATLPYVVKFDPNGDIIWENTFGPLNYKADLNKIQELDGGDFIAGGFMMGYDIDGYGHYGNLIKIGEGGEEIWYRTYQWADDSDCFFRDVIQSNDDGFIACGSASDSEFNTSIDAWVLKVDSMGCLVPGCGEVGVSNLEVQNTHFLVGSNPVNEVLNIFLLKLPQLSKHLVFELRDLGGKIVKTFDVETSEVTYMLPVSDLSSGTYILSLKGGTRMLQSEKIIKK